MSETNEQSNTELPGTCNEPGEQPTATPAAAPANTEPADPPAEGGEPAKEETLADLHESITEADKAIGAEIQIKLENIFGRANEGLPIIEELGGVEGIGKTLGTNLETGASADTIEHRRTFFGANTLPEEEPITFWQILLAAWSDHMIILLTIAAVVALILGLTVPHDGEDEVDYKKGWIEGFAIIVSVLIVTTVSSVNDYRKEQKFRQLTEQNSAQPIQVLRDGAIVTVDVTELVVGDLVMINPGLVMPVDGFYVKGMSVVVDESSVTGENDPKKKNPGAPIFLTGTVVNTAENCTVLVAAVGERSFGGKLLMSSRQEGGPSNTPLQDRLDDLANLIGRFGLGAALILFIALSIIEGVKFARDDPDADGQKYLEYFLLCVAIVVVAVPEGLPLAVTIALAYSQARMHDDNNQVRRLRACETMGNATQICSDKTGTLTQNLMSVVQGHLAQTFFKVNKPGDFPIKAEVDGLSADANEKIIDLLFESIAVNSSSSKVVVYKDKDGNDIPAKWVWETDKGNKTDNALLDFADRLVLTEEDNTNEETRPHQRRRAKYGDGKFMMFPFTSDRKRMSCIVHRDDGTFYLYVKGGSEQILPLCKNEIQADGTEAPISDERRTVIEGNIKSFANEANRTIGIAYAKLDVTSLPEDEPDTPLTWLSVVGIQDPLRPEVVEAVRKCQHAGVVVRMCTGDNIDTAIAISKQCGIYNRARGDIALTGKEFRNMVYDSFGDDERMEKFWPIFERMTVMARSQPLDKQLLVLMLMSRGEVVAVTGDGTNDAPALRLANVGFVMRSGTDIAVKSADIILLDDNFRSVQRAVVWGRTVNDNIRKFLQLQLTINVVSVLLTFIGSLITSTNSSPLTTVQLLWLNLIMDTLAALALATEAPSEDCLNRGPVHRKAGLVSRRMWTTILAAAFYSLACTLVILNVGHDWFAVEPAWYRREIRIKGNREHLTIVFNVFVMCALWQMLNARKLYTEVNIFEGFSRSWQFCIIFAFCFGFQAIAVELFGDFMQVHSLDWKQWLGCIAASIPVLPIVFLSRFLPIPEEVFPKEFDPEDLDDDAKKMLEKLTEEVAQQAQDREAARGQALDYGRQVRMRALWGKVRAHHVTGPQIVKAFRRAHQDGDYRSPQTVEMYSKFRRDH